MSPFGNKLIEKLPPLPKELKGFVRGAFQPHVRLAALSMPRGNGKSFLAARIARLLLAPEFSLSETLPNEVVVSSGSLEQSRVIFSFIEEAIPKEERQHFKMCNSIQRLWIQHRKTGARVRAIASRGKKALGLAAFNVLILDEPASLETTDGVLLYNAMRQSLGKRADQKMLTIGTLAPSEPGSWWPELVKAGSDKDTGVFVSCLAADPSLPWDEWDTIKSCNPMIRYNKHLKNVIQKELQEVKNNPSLQPSFEAFRLNRHVETRQEMLVSVEDWKRVESRPVPPRTGKPIVAIDLGQNRSWSACWILFENGRSECFAVCPGLPSLSDQEKRDGVPRGLYQDLYRKGTLIVDENLRVARPQVLIDNLIMRGIEPACIVADRFLIDALKDCTPREWPIVERKTRWSEATEDVTALRKLVLDGPLSITPECRSLAAYSLSQAIVVEDEGNLRVSKKRKWKSRDDIAITATLACGEFVRRSVKPQRSFRYVIL